ncbi:MAG: hypothetical protein J6T34_00300 [Bacilli bacterium]|nr:hypothetical protein [Bacilli bacterium]
MEKEFEVLADIRDRINIFTNFGYDVESECDDMIYDALDDVFAHHKVVYAKGVSKMCLIPDDTNWVLKVPFEGVIEYLYDEDDNEGYEDFVYNTCAHNSKNGWDYCLTEVEYFEIAKESGVAEFFAEERCFGECGTTKHPAYIQEKCVTYSETSWDDEKYKPSENSMEIVKSSDKYKWKSFNLDWIASAIDFYGEEKVDELFNFLNNHSEMTGDFHTGNYGYRVSDNSPVLIDYTGWLA